MHPALSNDIFYIVPEKCTECVGFHDQEACAAVCPVDCCVPNPEIPETHDVLLAAGARAASRTRPSPTTRRRGSRRTAPRGRRRPAAAPAAAATPAAPPARARARPSTPAPRRRARDPVPARGLGSADPLLPLRGRLRGALRELPRGRRVPLPALPRVVRADAQHGAGGRARRSSASTAGGRRRSRRFHDKRRRELEQFEERQRQELERFEKELRGSRCASAPGRADEAEAASSRSERDAGACGSGSTSTCSSGRTGATPDELLGARVHAARPRPRVRRTASSRAARARRALRVRRGRRPLARPRPRRCWRGRSPTPSSSSSTSRPRAAAPGATRHHRDRRGARRRRAAARHLRDAGEPGPCRSRRSSAGSPASPTRWSRTRRPSPRRCRASSRSRATAVLVAHNAAFDVGHLDAAQRALHRARAVDRRRASARSAWRAGCMPELAPQGARQRRERARHRVLRPPSRRSATRASRPRSCASSSSALGGARHRAARTSCSPSSAARPTGGRSWSTCRATVSPSVPPLPGVYHLLGEDGRLLYVGKARTPARAARRLLRERARATRAGRSR